MNKQIKRSIVYFTVLYCYCSIYSNASDLPPDNEYVVVNEQGQLSVNGERERFWAIIGKPLIWANIQDGDSEEIRAQKIDKSRKGTDRLVDRFEELGFNAVRLWYVAPNTNSYQVNDGSSADTIDYFISKIKEKGFRIWCAGLGNRVGYVTNEDVNIVDDPATADAWIEAINEYNSPKFHHKGKFKRRDIRHSLARIWDPRIEAVYIERMRANADHINKYTGLRWADDPAFAIWELTNEEWWMRKMVGGRWQSEPEFFRNELINKWNTWLLKKYGNSDSLKKAWGGLLPGESLKAKSILLAPMAGKTDAKLSMNDSNPEAREALNSIEQKFSRDDFSPQRASDVIAFFIELQLAHKTRCKKAVKQFGKSTRLGTVIYDTGIGYEIQSQYLHQNAEAVAHDAYVNGWGPRYKEPDLSEAQNQNRKMLKQIDAERISANTGPWVNWLLKPPGIAQGIPWLEHNRVEGKPYLVYETQIQQPAKYRADFPLRIAALASIQDWDWISWHYFSPHNEVGLVDEPFTRPLEVTTGGHPQGYHYTYDEVQNAMMRQASLIWRNEHLAPASSPTKFIYGRKSLTAPESMDYAGSYHTTGFDMLQTTYQYGVRVEIDPNREDDEVIGPVVQFSERHTHNPYTPTGAITFDWKKGYLMFDDPESIAFTGLLANYGSQVNFKNGFTLKDVTINNPEGIFSPVSEDEKYIAFAMSAEDGKPLSKTNKASLALVSTSFNSGFTMDPQKILEQGHPRHANTKAGGLPVLVARVGGTLESKHLNGMQYSAKDWHMNEITSGNIENGSLHIPSDLPIFIIELTREEPTSL